VPFQPRPSTASQLAAAARAHPDPDVDADALEDDLAAATNRRDGGWDVHAAHTVILEGARARPPPPPPVPSARRGPPPPPPPRARSRTQPPPIPARSRAITQPPVPRAPPPPEDVHREDTLILDRARLRR
jgi:hypothetical protein